MTRNTDATGDSNASRQATRTEIISRTLYDLAEAVFTKQFGRAPSSVSDSEQYWVAGYVAALLHASTVMVERERSE